MKEHIIIGIGITACVALCAAMWPRNAEVGDLPTKPVKAAVTAEIGPRLEVPPRIILSADSPAPEAEPAAEREPEEAEAITAEEKTEPAPSSATPESVLAQEAKPKEAPAPLAGPHMGDTRMVNGERQIYILGFGWVRDEGGGSVGILVDGKGDINKQVGIMGGSESPPGNTTPPGSEPPEPVDGEIHMVFAEAHEKNSAPPPYKPATTPPNP